MNCMYVCMYDIQVRVCIFIKKKISIYMYVCVCVQVLNYSSYAPGFLLSKQSKSSKSLRIMRTKKAVNETGSPFYTYIHNTHIHAYIHTYIQYIEEVYQYP